MFTAKEQCSGFICDNGLCTKSYKRCDGINHCDDNSDERNCSKYHTLSRLFILKLSNYQMTAIII